jgi:hypothetical protein
MNTNRQTAIKESNMKVTTPNLIRAAGLSAVVAGTIFAVIQPIHPPDVLASVNTSAFIIITTLKTIMSILGLYGVVGIYARQVEKTGWLGLAGYLLISLFYAVQLPFSFAEPFILPLLTTQAPQFVSGILGLASGAPSEVSLGALPAIYMSVAALYMLGTLLFGIATFRARILSRWAAGLLALSGPLSIILKMLGHPIDRMAAVPMGIALAWLGYSLWSERREKVSESVSGMGSPQLSQTGAK